MRLTRLFTEKRAVSSAIGNILLAALVIILAASAGVFALGLGDKVNEPAPKASFSINQSEQTVYASGPNSKPSPTVSITHEGGDAVDTENVNVTVNGDEAWGAQIVDPNAPDGPDHDLIRLWAGSNTIESGSSVTVVAANKTNTAPALGDGSGDLTIGPWDGTHPGEDIVISGDSTHIGLVSGDEVKIIWESDSGESSATLATHTVS